MMQSAVALAKTEEQKRLAEPRQTMPEGSPTSTEEPARRR